MPNMKVFLPREKTIIKVFNFTINPTYMSMNFGGKRDKSIGYFFYANFILLRSG